ncbi:hypothetical protein BVE84_02390 [Streptococcus azizii]|uniref:TipC family immunity protein n=1 Tax=Streptococcus azizii TaxID=1579424 RepID=A0AB36JS08_9STRE|nr:MULTISPECIES: TipC family immunity protein [Streptococcus]MBF0776700.1 TipC family immunity protein [Streptococcus sp. 19428wD3_AN2]ONK29114.1 hypothetical protein BVE86_01080 [Streptococcus azizii]ONK29660.1 hypothetical protein BVE85_02395 [Streptococcus azizii]ONK30597.1 hypothetical protein BVE84_02390 [Streptococcus azizii]TFU82519.1 hypothetical protein E4T83_08100 [Streptococcus sp. AN2]
MNKKTAYTLSIVVLVAMLIPLFLILFKPKYSNVFEEIYHDEYYHVTTSFLRTNSTLNSIPDMEKNRTRGLVYGSVSEQYRSEVLPLEVKSISYSFYYPDDKLEGGNLSINFCFLHTNGEYIDIYYVYKHNSGRLVQSIGIIGEKRLTEYDQVMEYVKEKQISISPYLNKSKDLLRSKVIPDWLRAYPSRFSKDHWGEVTIVEDSTGM